jgi:hypothetical protein
MNGSEIAYEPTAAQEAAMEEMKKVLGPTPIPVVFQHLVRNYPGVFQNNAYDQQVVNLHYIPSEFEVTPEQQEKEKAALEEQQKAEMESLDQQLEREEKWRGDAKETLEKRHQRQMEALEKRHKQQLEEQEQKSQPQPQPQPQPAPTP